MPGHDYPTWLKHQCELIGFYDRQVLPQHRQVRSWDLLLTAWQIRSGSVELVHAGGKLVGAPGDWLLIPPGLARQHRFSATAVIRSIRCGITGPGGQVPRLGLAPLRIVDGDTGLDAAADALGLAIHQGFGGTDRAGWRDQPMPPATWAVLHGAVLAWSAVGMDRLGIAGTEPPGDPRVAMAQRLLLAEPSPAALPWRALKEATGLSRPQLDRLFVRHCGGSVRAWSEGRLLATACQALEDPREPVKAVAGRLGFGDASHFCRWFRQRMGVSPADWRRRGVV